MNSMDKPARILVTGCLGNIGRAISARLIEAGWLVDGLDLPKKRSQMRPSGLSVHYLDLGDEATSSGRITEHLDGVTGVIHLAGYSRVGASKADPIGAVRANVLGSANLLEAIRLSEAQPWLLLASSLEVNVTDRGAHDFTNMYGLTKSIMELLARRYAGDYGLRIAAARIGGVYGATDDYPDKVPLVFARNAVGEMPMRVNSISRRMDYIHIDAVTAMLLEGMDRLAVSSRGTFAIFYVRSKQWITLLELARRVLRISGSTTRVTEFEDAGVIETPITHWEIDHPGPSLDEGLGKMIDLVRERSNEPERHEPG